MPNALDSIWLAGLPFAQTGGFWLPDPAATNPVTDRVFNLTLVICSLLFLLVVGLMVLFVVRYRRRPGRLPQKSAAHNTLLEATWTVIPVMIVSVIFYQGFVGLHADADGPARLLRSARLRPGNGLGSSSIPTDTSIRNCMSRPASPCD